MAVDTLIAQPSIITTTSPPRKRKRRTTTTGATEDCFACQDTQTTCDRRRPYCTQCIDRGRTCSGYKTTLTWGVGVASRGKLRGQTLPIAKQPKTTEGSKEKKESITKPIPVKKPNSLPKLPTTFDFVPVDPNQPVTAPAPRSTPAPQHDSIFTQQIPSIPTSNVRKEGIPSKRHIRHLSLQVPSQPAMSPYLHSPGPMTASTISYSPFEPFESGPHTPIYDSPIEAMPLSRYFPNTNAWTGDFATQYLGQPAIIYADSPASASMAPGPTSQPRSMLDLDGFDASASVAGAEEVEDIGRGETELSLTKLYGLGIGQVGSTKVLRELINYFDHVISPVIVAFESPSNPYRSHILPLASQSSALQHAIAALSASNLRIRKDSEQAYNARRLALPVAAMDDLHNESVRKSSIAHSMLRDSLGENEHAVPGCPSARELYHKGEAIKALNANLQDLAMRDDDSVLATLLILCLYHICDTGVAKFKTQFAGVKRILTLRSKRITSSESLWMITMFRWFDAMAATVNDREGQFDEVDIQDDVFQTDEWALENLAGCDSRLFNIISRLGRLNLLSQGKAVRGTMPSRALPVRPGRFDGLDAKDWSKDTSDSSRSQFWAEFSSIRQELSDWSFDSTTIPITMTLNDNMTTGSNTNDLRNISEAFRFAALLYTERLGNPSAHSSAANIQSLVTSAIHYIDAVKSDVYLLWPLFITGTECVLDTHRDLIRRRCLSIQGDSGFYNNTSTLRILEEVWADTDKQTSSRQENVHRDAYSLPESFSTGGALKWRKAMMHTAMDGEYIVV